MSYQNKSRRRAAMGAAYDRASRRADGSGMASRHSADDAMTDGSGGPAHGPSFAGKQGRTYQNGPGEDEAGEPGDYLGGSKQQSVPAKGRGANAPKPPTPPGQRGTDARAFTALQALLHAIRNRPSHPGRTAMGARLTDAPGLIGRTRRPKMPDSGE